MKSFIEFLLESEDWPADLDAEFLKRAMKITSFNLLPSDFISVKHKKEIQHIIHVTFFPEFDMKQLLDKVEPTKLANVIKNLRESNPKAFTYLAEYNLKGVGPGEVLLYFILNNAYLGGGSSAGIDLIDPSGEYEVKAVDYSPKGVVKNFKLGGTFPVAHIIDGVLKLRNELGLVGEKGGVNQGQLAEIEKAYPEEIKEYYKEYREIAYKEYFSKHPIIFLANNNGSTYRKGDLIAIKNVKKEEIYFERITSGVIKPVVKI